MSVLKALSLINVCQLGSEVVEEVFRKVERMFTKNFNRAQYTLVLL